MEWRPIESAPNGDTPILVCYVSDGEPTAHVVKAWMVHASLNKQQAAKMYQTDGSWPQPKRFYYSHWMPLPPLPAAETN